LFRQRVVRAAFTDALVRALNFDGLKCTDCRKVLAAVRRMMNNASTGRSSSLNFRKFFNDQAARGG